MLCAYVLNETHTVYISRPWQFEPFRLIHRAAKESATCFLTNVIIRINAIKT